MNNVRYVTHGDNKNFYGFGDKNSVTGDVLYTKMAVVYTGLQLVENPVSWRDASFSGFVTNSKLSGTIHDAEKVMTFAVATEADKTKKEFSNKKVTINFPTGSYLLTGDNKYTIQKEFLDILRTYQKARIRIEGNTDNTGNYESNVALSLKRAQAVKDYLVSEYGVDANRIIVIGNGPKHAVADNVSGDNINYRVTDFQLVQ
jgi:NitT/TauT family transport system substrate-binding protein